MSTVRRRSVLVACVAGASLVALDGTVLMAAQPGLQRGLGATVAQAQWVSTAYLVAVAALLVVCGRLGDRYGHRRMLVLGALGFGAASAGIALAPATGWVIGLRVLQGVFAAVLQPATLALLRTACPADRLAGAVAVRTGAIGIASAAGPVLGGALVALLGWRAVFLLNLPFALGTAALALAVRTPPPDAAGRAGGPSAEGPAVTGTRLNTGGAALLATTLALLVATLVEVPARGWTSAPALLGFAVTLGAAVLFVLSERSSGNPLVPAAVARSVPVAASMAMLLVIAAGVFGALFAVTYQLQTVAGLDAFTGSLHGLPLPLLMVVGAPLTGRALGRIGARRTATGGVLLTVLGIALLSRVGSGWVEAAGFAAVGLGFAAVMVTATGTVVGDAPAGYAGVVGGLKQTAVNTGSTLGVAVAAGLMPMAATSIAATTTTTTTATAAAPAAAIATGPTLLTLAAVAALALVPALLLPPRRRSPGDPGDPTDPTDPADLPDQEGREGRGPRPRCDAAAAA